MPDTILKSLTITAREDNADMDPVQRAKANLIQNLKQQQIAAEAMVNGEAYTVPHTITVEEDGVKVRKQINKPIKAWYWRDSVGQVRFSVRVANKRIELAKGSTDIIVGDDAALPNVVATVLKAVEAGELDKAVAAAVNARKSRS
ncbi:hypothetical protein JYU08_00630 [bacterium AH-315-B06]|nr:hypothetical protein [bacterium AH-315-B06]